MGRDGGPGRVVVGVVRGVFDLVAGVLDSDRFWVVWGGGWGEGVWFGCLALVVGWVSA